MKLATDMIADAAARPTYDELMGRDPKTMTREDRLVMIETLRMERAQWQNKEQAKADKKAEKEAA